MMTKKKVKAAGRIKAQSDGWVFFFLTKGYKGPLVKYPTWINHFYFSQIIPQLEVEVVFCLANESLT